MWNRALLGIVVGVFSCVAVAGGWRLPNGYFIPAKMPMTLVFPRPDSETAPWARQRRAYADGTVQYRVPIVVQGGAYPFHYSLDSGPSGMTIGSDIGNPEYGIVTWTPTAAQIRTAAYPVTVTVTDQEGHSVTATWSVQATTAGFVFVDPKAAVNGNGSKGSPFNSVAPLFVLHGTTGPYAGDIVYFRSGTTVLSGPEALGNVQLQSDGNPAVWLGYPGENATIDFSHSKVLVDKQDDVFIGGLRFVNARNDVPNAHFFFFNQNYPQSRVTFFEDRFDSIGRGTVGSDNPAAITLFNPGALRKYLAIVDCSLDHFSAPLVDAYAISYAVIEGNTLYSGNVPTVDQGIFLKSDIQDVSVRRNTSLSQPFGYGAIEVYQQAQRFTNANIEVAYNLVRATNPRQPAFVYEWTGVGGGANVDPQIYVYRNTFSGWIGGLDDFPYTVWEENNVLIDDSGQTAKFNVSAAGGKTVKSVNNLTGTSADGLIDADGKLIGAASQYRGTRGYEISVGVNPLSAPTWR